MVCLLCLGLDLWALICPSITFLLYVINDPSKQFSIRILLILHFPHATETKNRSHHYIYMLIFGTIKKSDKMKPSKETGMWFLPLIVCGLRQQCITILQIRVLLKWVKLKYLGYYANVIIFVFYHLSSYFSEYYHKIKQ